MKAALATVLYRGSLVLSHALFRAAMRVDRDAISAILLQDTDDQLSGVVEAFIDLGEARRLAGPDK